MLRAVKDLDCSTEKNYLLVAYFARIYIPPLFKIVELGLPVYAYMTLLVSSHSFQGYASEYYIYVPAVRKLYSTTLFHHKLFMFSITSCISLLRHYPMGQCTFTSLPIEAVLHFLFLFTILWPGTYP